MCSLEARTVKPFAFGYADRNAAQSTSSQIIKVGAVPLTIPQNMQLLELVIVAIELVSIACIYHHIYECQLAEEAIQMWQRQLAQNCLAQN